MNLKSQKLEEGSKAKNRWSRMNLKLSLREVLRDKLNES